jgi:hypothetical protein
LGVFANKLAIEVVVVLDDTDHHGIVVKFHGCTKRAIVAAHQEVHGSSIATGVGLDSALKYFANDTGLVKVTALS